MWGRLALGTDNAPEKMEQYLDAGIQVYMTSIDTAVSLCWDGRDGYFFEKYEAHLKRLVTKKPDIKLVLYLGGLGGSPYYWCHDNKEELTQFHNGKMYGAASIASEKWKVDSSNAYRKFIDHFENSEYADNIIGYNPVYNANEWFSHHRVHDHDYGVPDFSKPMLKRFKAWLKERYQNDVSALRKSWKDDTLTFETVRIPAPEERKSATDTNFFYTETELGNKISDYFECYDETLADLSINYCQVIKEQTMGKKLAGMMHAYSYCGRYDNIPHNHGHSGALKIIASPYVDFLHSPYHYYNRSVGGYHFSQHSTDSVQLHGKLLVDQIDSKTHLRHGPNHNASTPWESQQLIKRDVAYSLTKNVGCYWVEGGPGDMFPTIRNKPKRFSNLWYDDPEIKATIAKLKKLDDENQHAKVTNNAEVAIFTSSAGVFRRKMERIHGKLYVEVFRQWIIGETGAPFDDYILEDFPNLTRKYKVYVFLNPHYISSAMREQITNTLKAQNATALWFYAPGYLDEKGGQLENMKALTGIELARTDYEGFIDVKLNNTKHSYLEGVEAGKTFGTGQVDFSYYQKGLLWLRWAREYDKNKERELYKFTPAFYSTDKEATVLGELTANKEPGFVVKKVDGMTSIFCSAPIPPARVIRNIFEESGVHIYSKDHDLVYANKQYVVLCANSGAGSKTVHLPGNHNVYDALEGTALATNTNSYSFEAQHKETVMLKIEKA